MNIVVYLDVLDVTFPDVTGMPRADAEIVVNDARMDHSVSPGL